MHDTTNHLSIEKHANGLFAILRRGVQVDHVLYESLAVEYATGAYASDDCPLLYGGWRITQVMTPACDKAIGWALYCDGFRRSQCENNAQRAGWDMAAAGEADTLAAAHHAPTCTHFNYR